MNNVDKQYLDLCTDILHNGATKNTRSGDVKSVFGRQLRFDLTEGLPILTTKKVYTKGIIHELLWFLRGNTNIKYLVENNVHIWDGDAYRYYCEKVKTHNEILEYFNEKYKETKSSAYNVYPWYQHIETEPIETFLKNVLERKSIFLNDKPYYFEVSQYNYTYGDLGKVYGKQWRAFGHPQVDQIRNLIETLKTNPDDRRMVCVAFNPSDVKEMALPPCHVMFQLYTKPISAHGRVAYAREHNLIDYERDKNISNLLAVNYSNIDWQELNKELDELNVPTRKLSLMWTQRSVDVGLGLPFNITSYAILTHIFAKLANMIPDELVCSLGDCHIYSNEFEGIKTQLERKGFDELPKLVIDGNQSRVEDFKYDDFKIIDYKCEDAIKMPLSVG